MNIILKKYFNELYKDIYNVNKNNLKYYEHLSFACCNLKIGKNEKNHNDENNRST